jgi:hypothetical protein
MVSTYEFQLHSRITGDVKLVDRRHVPVEKQSQRFNPGLERKLCPRRGGAALQSCRQWMSRVVPLNRSDLDRNMSTRRVLILMYAEMLDVSNSSDELWIS